MMSNRKEQSPVVNRLDQSALTAPLNFFYSQEGSALPPLEEIEALAMPQPYRDLLVHHNDMTPTLEAHYREELDLRVLRRQHTEHEYAREVVLTLKTSRTPVEFGANRICLNFFPEEARGVILEEKRPLGHIMKDFSVHHTCQPNAFFRVASDPIINEALDLTGAQVLYGRHNRLFNLEGELISEVVEILRPSPSTLARSHQDRHSHL